MLKPIKFLLGLTFLVAISGCATYPPLTTADKVNPIDFQGEWYVIANIPYFAEKGKVGSKVSYLPTEKDGVYRDLFTARDENFESEIKELEGVAKVLNAEHTELQSIFYWVIRSRFSVLHMEDNWMLLGHRNRKYAWVMARDSQINDQQYQRALAIFAERGYEPSKFKKVPQKPEDLGKPEYQ